MLGNILLVALIAVAPGAAHKGSRKQRAKRHPRVTQPVPAPTPAAGPGLTAPAPPPPQPAPAGSIAFIGVELGDGVPPEVGGSLTHSLETALHALAGASLRTSAQVADVLGVARQKNLLGGSGPQQELAALVGQAESLVSAKVETSPDGYRVTARRVDPNTGATLQSAELPVKRNDAEGLLAAGEVLTRRLFPERSPQETKTAARPRTRPLRVAVMDVRAEGDIPPRALAGLNQSLTPELRKLQGVSAISSAEVRDMIGIERQKELLGCSDEATSCLEELAGALDADELVTIDLTLLGTKYAMTSRRTDLRSSKIVQVKLKSFDKRDGEELLAVVGPTIEALYPERPLKPGRVRGIEPELIRRLNPPPLPRWAFFTTGALAVAAGAAGGGFGYLSLDAQRDYRTLAQRSTTEAVPGSELKTLELRARDRAFVANVLLGTAAGLGVAAGIEAFFTDWRNDRAAFTAAPVVSSEGAGIQVGAAF